MYNLWCVTVDASAKLIDLNEITPQSNYVWIESNGSCLWQPRFELSITHCNVEVTWFPFDVQRCKLIFESWILADDKLNITTFNETNAFRDYVSSDQWDLTCEYSCQLTTS